MLAVATGLLALSQRQSWTRSVHDQAAFSTGADVRVQTSRARSRRRRVWLPWPGHRGSGRPCRSRPSSRMTTNGVTLAVDSGRAADVTLLRPDQSPVPAAGLFGKIQPSGPPPGVITAGPSCHDSSFTARLGPQRCAWAGPP